jgi:hypothetical protein
MSQALADFPVPTLPPLDEATARAHADQLRSLAAEHGITQLRFASAGRLVGHVGEEHDTIDTAEFQIAVEDALGKQASLFVDRIFKRAGVSSDLLAATPL